MLRSSIPELGLLPSIALSSELMQTGYRGFIKKTRKEKHFSDVFFGFNRSIFFETSKKK
ncbi:MAG: hypothetical protein LWW97_11055 [Deltaproteobacteria bacterium]|nr:hypothetical protein [Deltaproteobacteria bacterium]